ncbi:hypothetical protein [Spirochaeta isovalerica]|uniref:Uncharacterized protein n=1 Tax=Spirochaeta isovalerica TaxID=150 RepID=A0A841R7N8_9SPIO|nr:hypothetical protein [Spirochaeta isovalerica]MBB6481284.1 hypothetical protein [Spirochaeta isovalerica]
MKKIHLVLLIGLLYLPLFLYGGDEREEKLVFSTLLYGGESDVPLSIDSDRSWIDLGQINTEEINNLEIPDEGVIRKWRVRTTYSDETVAGQSTIQIKLRTDSSKAPLFTLPWSEGRTGWKENYSNWFQTDFEGRHPLLGDQGVSSVRLIAPPGVSTPGIIYKIELEAWDIREIEAEESIQSLVQMASTAVIPEIRAVRQEAGEKNRVLERKEPDEDQALRFALNFINDSLMGDLPAFYDSISDKVYSLATGEGGSKYRVPPPARQYEGFSFSDYRENYEAKIYSYEEYADMFPQWLDGNRGWTPDRHTWLFHGSAVREGKEAVLQNEILVFMVEMIDGEWKLIALPE